MPNNAVASSALEFSPWLVKSHSTNSYSDFELKKRHDTTPLESIKCSTKLFGSVTALLLKVGFGKSFRPSKLRPCNNSVRLRSNATSNFGCAPKDANTPPVRGFIKVTHITGYFPPNEASLTNTGKPCSSKPLMPARILGYFANTSCGTSGKVFSPSKISRFTARSKISDKHCTCASAKVLPALIPLLKYKFSIKFDGKYTTSPSE